MELSAPEVEGLGRVRTFLLEVPLLSVFLGVFFVIFFPWGLREALVGNLAPTPP